MTNWAQVERGALVEALRQAGPDAATLCTGWTTRDLAAHVVVRERRPDAAVGIVVPALAGHAERVRAGVAALGWDELVDLVASGPPALLRPVDRAMNLVEMHVHCEDVRRAAPGWTPRTLETGLDAALWQRAGQMARILWRRSPVRVRLTTPDGRSAGPADAPVTVVGLPSELLLAGMGREAMVTWLGREADVAAAQGSDRSV